MRYIPFMLCGLLSLLCLILSGWHWGFFVTGLFFGLITLSGIYDLVQTGAPVLRNYPIIGRLRYLLQEVRPQIRQYFIEADDEEVPYSRQQRALIADRAKAGDTASPFGSLVPLYAHDHVWINHSLAPVSITNSDFRIKVGEGDKAYPCSVINISGTSYGAVSGQAIESFNRGASLGGFAHNTGEGGLSQFHQTYGGDLIWQIGTGYFGCRTEAGVFSPEAFQKTACMEQVKMIEVKLSQGAKPGHGGMLLAAKVTPEIAKIRGVPAYQDCVSPPQHTSFHNPVGLLRFIDELRALSGGKPVGFKICIGHPWEVLAIAKAMVESGIVPDFITIDGAEGGTGAAPAEFLDHIGCPLKDAVVYVDNILRGVNLRHRVKLAASGKLVSGFDVARICALGADWVNMARPFMFSIGCIQARSCHNGNCPTGITTLNPSRTRAINVEQQSKAVAAFQHHTREALAELIGAAGLAHPEKLTRRHLVQRVSQAEILLADQIYPRVDVGAVLAGVHTGDPRIDNYWHRLSGTSFHPAN